MESGKEVDVAELSEDLNFLIYVYFVVGLATYTYQLTRRTATLLH